MAWMKRSLILLLLLPAALCRADLKGDLRQVWKLDPGAVSETTFQRILAAKPSAEALSSAIRGFEFEPMPAGSTLHSVHGTDMVDRPWVLMVPPGYDASKPYPLMVVLHGGVSRDKVSSDPLSEAKHSGFESFCSKYGMILAFPFGQVGATWWDRVGMANIHAIVRQVKSLCNVDDDRVSIGGFSDGSSGTFLFAMAKPSDFASFIALNGHMGVPVESGNLTLYGSNFVNTPVYAVTSDQDELYPTHSIAEMMAFLQKAGAQITYRTHPGHHQFSYAAEEIPLIAAFMEHHVRDPFVNHIEWETADAEFGSCRWLHVNGVSNGNPAAWYHDVEPETVDDLVNVGFYADFSYSGKGVKVDVVLDGPSLANGIGLQHGDIIIHGGDVVIDNLNDFAKFRSELSRGSTATLTISRNGEEKTLSGQLPPIRRYPTFKHDRPPAMVKATYANNRFDLLTSRCASLTIDIYPEMIQTDKPVVVIADGKEIFNSIITPDISFMLRRFNADRDRKALPIAQIVIRP